VSSYPRGPAPRPAGNSFEAITPASASSLQLSEGPSLARPVLSVRDLPVFPAWCIILATSEARCYYCARELKG